jgi:predicted methyltransferase
MDCSCDNFSDKFLMFLPETLPAFRLFLGRGWGKKEGNNMADQNVAGISP